MKPTAFIILISMLLTGCKFSKSVKKDLASGLTATGEDITCEDVYLTVNNERTTRNSFIYGETFYMNFDDVKGFARENGNVFPGLVMTVINQAGDTIWKTDDLYSKSTEGFNYSPLILNADLTVAAPIQSKNEYSLFIDIWDKKGKGKFKTKFDFKVRENELITVETSGVSYNETYLFSQGSNRIITDNKIGFDDNIYVIIEGLKGFKEENGMVYPGISIKIIDAANNVIVNSEDLFVNYSEAGVAIADLTTRVSAHFFSISGEKFINPLHCEMVIWDKKSNARIKATTNLTLE
jgi:hypothetical protein